MYLGGETVENHRLTLFLFPYRYHHDIHGNVTFLLDWNGNQIVEKYAYDAFGKPEVRDAAGNLVEYPDHTPRSAVGNRFMFQGREYLQELGIYDYRHRYYHPGLGRFIQTDPTGFDAGDMNLFRYCGDDPVDRSDPMGLDFSAEIQLRPDLENIPNVLSSHFGGTAGVLNIRAEVVNGKIVFHDVDIHATSYIRTQVRSGVPLRGYETKNRSKQDIVRTVTHEATVHLPHHEQYYRNTRDAIRKDLEDGKTYSPQTGREKISEKQEAWRKNSRQDYLSRGTAAHAANRNGLERDSKPDGNPETPSRTIGRGSTSAGALDDALKTLMSVGGGEWGEGVHPRGGRRGRTGVSPFFLHFVAHDEATPPRGVVRSCKLPLTRPGGTSKRPREERKGSATVLGGKNKVGIFKGTNAMNQYTTMNGATSQYDQNFNLYTLNGWRYDTMPTSNCF